MQSVHIVCVCVCVYMGLHAYVFVAIYISACNLHIFGCMHTYVCVFCHTADGPLPWMVPWTHVCVCLCVCICVHVCGLACSCACIWVHTICTSLGACIHTCVCVLSHCRWSIAITGSPDTSLIIFVAVECRWSPEPSMADSGCQRWLGHATNGPLYFHSYIQ